MGLDYSKLSQTDFDAIATGELMHLALHLELEINEFLVGYFLHRSQRKDEFRVHFFYRDCLTFQEKIDIAKAVINSNSEKFNDKESNQIFKIIEYFKSLRNTLAHGLDASTEENNEPKFCVETYSRSGKRKVIEITPQNHNQLLNDFEMQFEKVVAWRKKVIRILNKK